MSEQNMNAGGGEPRILENDCQMCHQAPGILLHPTRTETLACDCAKGSHEVKLIVCKKCFQES